MYLDLSLWVRFVHLVFRLFICNYLYTFAVHHVSSISASLCSKITLLIASLLSKDAQPISPCTPSFGVFPCAPNANLPTLLCRISNPAFISDLVHNTTFPNDSFGTMTPHDCSP
uniref:Putative secreted protein n=1 Tax=Ixodes scapularis TaxID=6945 RepID=A0A4D5REH6_IXOSC